MKKTDPKEIADFDNISAADLASDDKMRLLYAEAVRRGFWVNETGNALDFFAFAEKAMRDDKHGTPGKLFYSLIKKKDRRFITDVMEDAARKRFGRGDLQELVDFAADRTLQARPTPEETQDLLFGRDIGFQHGIMMQCFLPQKEMPVDTREWQVNHGKASMLVEAGRVVENEQQGVFRKCGLPSGAKARLIIPYIVGYAVQRNTREIDMGRSLRRFMENLKVPITGPNGKAFTREVQNVAAANFYLGGWDEQGAKTQFARIAKELSFWIERREDQQSFWRPEMVLSADFFETIKERRVPVDMSHLVKLQRSPRRMDLYNWFSYRLPRIRQGKRVPIKLGDLQPIFAPEIIDPHLFKQRFKGDLKALHGIYDGFRLSIGGDILWLEKSAPPVPAKITKLLC